ncbi:MAG: LysR family transcriptional regulator [Bacteroidota bacterium]
MLAYRLQVFRAVAQHLSFSQAARSLHITQPAISKHIRLLEEAQEVKLFRRQGNKIQLTEAGRTLLAYVEKVLMLDQKWQADLQRYHQQTHQSLKVGACTTLAQYLLPRIISDFLQANPSLNIQLSRGSSAEIQRLVQTGRLHLGVVGEEVVDQDLDLAYTYYLDDAVVLASSAPPASSHPLNWEEVGKKDLVIRSPGSGTRALLTQQLQELGIQLADLKVIMELDSTESLKSFLLSGPYWGWIPRYAILRELETGLLHAWPVQDGPLLRRYGFIYAHQQAANPLLQDFMRQCQEDHNFRFSPS